MNQRMSLAPILLLGSVIVAVGLGITGCEEATGLAGLALDPASMTLTPDQETFSVAVTGGITNDTLALPLSWSVTDSSLGTISHSGGAVAVYRRSSANGVNTIIARDQYDNEGFCVVDQVAAAYEIALTASPASPITVGTATTISITLTEGISAPYVWELVSGPGSVSAGSGSSSAVYSSDAVGVGVIRVTDANGAQGLISVVVEAADGGGDGDPGGAGGV